MLPDCAGETIVIHVYQMSSVFNIASPFLYLVTGTAMVVFVCFGIWSLRQRFLKYEEWAIRTQVLVVLLVFLFYILEIAALRVLLVTDPVYFLFSLLGLFAAGLALYGHVLVSLLSRMLVELVVPNNPGNRDVPRLGPAEILEHAEDWEGALNEYYVLAQIYPGNPLIYRRIAKNLIKLERPGEAAQWLERSLNHTDRPEDALLLLRRLWDVRRALGDHEGAREAVYGFVRRFPDFEASPLLLRQLGGEGQTGNANNRGIERPLESLASHPLDEEYPGGKAPLRPGKHSAMLEAMEDAGDAKK